MQVSYKAVSIRTKPWFRTSPTWNRAAVRWTATMMRSDVPELFVFSLVISSYFNILLWSHIFTVLLHRTFCATSISIYCNYIVVQFSPSLTVEGQCYYYFTFLMPKSLQPLALHQARKMENVYSPKTVVSTYKSTWWYNPENQNRYTPKLFTPSFFFVSYLSNTISYRPTRLQPSNSNLSPTNGIDDTRITFSKILYDDDKNDFPLKE
jgi:hypothetical protein